MFPKNAGSLARGEGSRLLSPSNIVTSWRRRRMTTGKSSFHCIRLSTATRCHPKYHPYQNIQTKRTVNSSVFASPLTISLYATGTNTFFLQYSTSTPMFQKDDHATRSSPFATNSTTTTKTNPHQRKKRSKFIPRKAAVQLSERSRSLFQKLLASQPDKDGILLNYHQSSTGEPRMVYTFQFITKDELVEEDEGYVFWSVVTIGWLMTHDQKCNLS
jgi:hypothetical protein